MGACNVALGHGRRRLRPKFRRGARRGGVGDGWKMVRGLPRAGLGSKLGRRGARRRGTATPSGASRGSDCSSEVDGTPVTRGGR
jgi:hypothetical protein